MLFRSNFIVGFPGESESEYRDLVSFITEARLDAIGIFGYSDEDGTEAMTHEKKIEAELINERLAELTTLSEELMFQRASARIGERVRVLVEDSEGQEGRADHQGPEVDGNTALLGGRGYKVGEYVEAVVADVAGADLVAQPL